MSAKRALIESDSTISIQRQCAFLGLSRSSFYYICAQETELNFTLMNLIDSIYKAHSFYGSRRIRQELKRLGYRINRKRIMNLMKKMGICAIYPKRNLSFSNVKHFKYPYLLRGLKIDRPLMVWSTDITYIKMEKGFMYLAVVLDWHSRYVIAWSLSNTLDASFSLKVIEEAFSKGKPMIFNSDQGTQYTSKKHIDLLKHHDIQISMDGRGRAFDNIFVERFWRSVKYEDIYIKAYENGNELYKGLEAYFSFYNERRPHQSLAYATPYEVHFGQKQAASVCILDKLENLQVA